MFVFVPRGGGGFQQEFRERSPPAKELEGVPLPRGSVLEARHLPDIGGDSQVEKEPLEGLPDLPVFVAVALWVPGGGVGSIGSRRPAVVFAVGTTMRHHQQAFSEILPDRFHREFQPSHKGLAVLGGTDGFSGMSFRHPAEVFRGFWCRPQRILVAGWFPATSPRIGVAANLLVQETGFPQAFSRSYRRVIVATTTTILGGRFDFGGWRQGSGPACGEKAPRIVRMVSVSCSGGSDRYRHPSTNPHESYEDQQPNEHRPGSSSVPEKEKFRHCFFGVLRPFRKQNYRSLQKRSKPNRVGTAERTTNGVRFSEC